MSHQLYYTDYTDYTIVIHRLYSFYLNTNRAFVRTNNKWIDNER